MESVDRLGEPRPSFRMHPAHVAHKTTEIMAGKTGTSEDFFDA